MLIARLAVTVTVTTLCLKNVTTLSCDKLLAQLSLRE